ncbi:hypothetical protein JCM16303_001427 [Sporobolomyces ruberrimus]
MSNLFPLPFKRTQPVDFAASLTSYVADHSTTTHPSQIKHDAERLGKLRREIYGIDGSVLVFDSNVENLLTYQAQLHCCLAKFPDTAGPAFVYSPIFSSDSTASNLLPPGGLPSSSTSPSSESTENRSITYELLCTLYNLAALYTHLALSHRSSVATRDQQQSGDSLKTCINHLQSSLGTLDKLLTLSSRYQKQHNADRDLHVGVVRGWRGIVLGMIQELGWQKSLIDRLKNGTVAKLASQVEAYYRESRSHFEGVEGDYLPKEWQKYLELKQNHFEAVSQYRRSLDDLGANRYGDEIGRLSHSVQILKTTLNSITSLSLGGSKPTKGGVLDTVMKDSKGFLKFLEENLKRANKDNDLIYLAHPTPLSSLPSIVPFALARSTPPPLITSPLSYLSNDLVLFKEMETKEITRVVEIWNDRKDVWVREEIERGWTHQRENELGETMKGFGLPGSLEEDDMVEREEMERNERGEKGDKRETARSVVVPSRLLELGQELERMGGTKRLELLFGDVRKVSDLNQRLLNETSQYIESERTTQQFYLDLYGPRVWTRDSATADPSSPLRERYDYFKSLLSKAKESDLIVRKKYSDREVDKKLKQLEGGKDELIKVLPAPTLAKEVTRERTGGQDRKTREEEEEKRVEKRKLKRQLRAIIEELKELERERQELGTRIKRLAEQWDIRDEALRKSQEIASRRNSGQGGAVEEDDGENGLEEFEEVLGEEMRRLRNTFREEIDLNDKSYTDLLDSLKSLNSAFVTLLKSNQTRSQNETSSPSSQPDQSPASSQYREIVESYSQAFARFNEMLGNLEEGLKFYGDLSRLWSELRDQSKEFAYSRNLEAQELDKQITTPSTQPTEEQEPQEAEAESDEEEDIPAEDPISQAFSKPITQSTPRRSTRRTTSSDKVATSSPRTIAPVPKSASSARASARKQKTAQEPEREKEVRRSQKEAVPEGAGSGGWDPSMGIRFG